MPKNPLVFSNITVDAITWTAIVVPVDCDYLALFNTSGGWLGVAAQAITLRSDQNDVNTAKPLLPGNQEIVSSTKQRYFNAEPRFSAGSVLCWAKADSATAALILTCVF